MRCVLAVAVMLMIALGVVCAGGPIKAEYWERLPDNQKVEFTVRDFFGDTTLKIQVFILTCENWRLLHDDPDKDCAGIHAIATQFSGERQPMIVWVGNASSSSQFFFPWMLAFSQGARQWEVALWGDYYAEDDSTFHGGQLRPGLTTWGVVAIPERLDLTQPFRLWYDDSYGVLDPRPEQRGKAEGIPDTEGGYTIGEVRDVSFANAVRKVTDVVLSMSREVTNQELLSIARDVVDHITTMYAVNAVGVFIWFPEQDIGAEPAVASVHWAPWAEWSRAMDVTTGNYSHHEYKIVFNRTSGS